MYHMIYTVQWLFNDASLISWWCKICMVIQQQFWMKECDIISSGMSRHTLTPPTHFQWVRIPNPQDLRPCPWIWHKTVSTVTSVITCEYILDYLLILLTYLLTYLLDLLLVQLLRLSVQPTSRTTDNLFLYSCVCFCRLSKDEMGWDYS